jgi:hypothetical protein
MRKLLVDVLVESISSSLRVLVLLSVVLNRLYSIQVGGTSISNTDLEV